MRAAGLIIDGHRPDPSEAIAGQIDAGTYRQLQRAPNRCIVYTCLFAVDEQESGRGKFLFCRFHWSAMPRGERKLLRQLYREDWKRWYDRVDLCVRTLVLREEPLYRRFRWSDKCLPIDETSGRKLLHDLAGEFPD